MSSIKSISNNLSQLISKNNSLSVFRSALWAGLEAVLGQSPCWLSAWATSLQQPKAAIYAAGPNRPKPPSEQTKKVPAPEVVWDRKTGCGPVCPRVDGPRKRLRPVVAIAAGGSVRGAAWGQGFRTPTARTPRAAHFKQLRGCTHLIALLCA